MVSVCRQSLVYCWWHVPCLFNILNHSWSQEDGLMIWRPLAFDLEHNGFHSAPTSLSLSYMRPLYPAAGNCQEEGGHGGRKQDVLITREKMPACSSHSMLGLSWITEKMKPECFSVTGDDSRRAWKRTQSEQWEGKWEFQMHRDAPFLVTLRTWDQWEV